MTIAERGRDVNEVARVATVDTVRGLDCARAIAVAGATVSAAVCPSAPQSLPVDAASRNASIFRFVVACSYFKFVAILSLRM